MKYIIKTERLNLREINEKDFGNLKAIISDPITMSYYKKPYDDQGVNKWIEWCLACYKKRGFGLWAVELKDGTFIGDCGITLQDIDGKEVFEIGYHLNRQYWRNHYGTEAAEASKKWFFENTSYEEVYSYMNVDNLGSRGVAKRNGMRFIKDYYKDDEHLAVYRITKEEYLKGENKMINEMKILKDLEFTRIWGTKEELKAAKYISGVLKEMGIDNKIESFKLNTGVKEKVSLEVSKPYKKKYPCEFYKMCGNTEGLKKEIVFIKDTNQIDKYDVNDKIALIQGRLGYWTYKDLIDAGCKGIVIGVGFLYSEDKDIDIRELREPLQKLGKLPIVECNIKDLYEMISEGASEIKMISLQKETECTSQNVVARIEGSSKHDIVLTAHYDSTALSKGSWDNASGSVGLLKIAEYFKEFKPYHNLIFVWCGAEERGLYGSKAYVKKHKKELDNIDLCINLDMIGSTLGKLLACVTGENKMVNYLEYMAKEYGKACYCYQDVYSSDSTPFADKGIPAISFGQGNSATPIHWHFDNMYYMNEKTLIDDEKYIIEFVKRMANAKVIPIKREMPKEMKDKLDEYLLRKRPENK